MVVFNVNLLRSMVVFNVSCNCFLHSDNSSSVLSNALYSLHVHVVFYFIYENDSWYIILVSYMKMTVGLI